MPEKQLLHLVIGGELEDLEHNTFRDLTKIDLGQPISIDSLTVHVMSQNDYFDLKTKELTIVNSQYSPIPQER